MGLEGEIPCRELSKVQVYSDLVVMLLYKANGTSTAEGKVALILNTVPGLFRAKVSRIDDFLRHCYLSCLVS